jgi:lipopolysaccharide export system permease protein
MPFLQSFLYALPAFIVDLFPFVMLLTTWVTVAVFRRNGEWTAFLGTGLSPGRLAAPMWAMGIGVSLLFFSLGGTLVPHGLKTAREIDRPARDTQASLVKNETWFLSDPRSIWSVRVIDVDTGQMHGVRLFRLNADFSLREEWKAKTLIKNDSDPTGILRNGVLRTFNADGTMHEEAFLEKEVGPLRGNFGRLEIKPREMTSRQLQGYIREMSDAGFNVRRHLLELEARRAFPFENFVIVLLTVALAVGQMKPLAALFLSLGLGFAYGAFFSTAMSLGQGSILPAWVAAWSTNLLYFSIGLSLLLYVPRRRHTPPVS